MTTPRARAREQTLRDITRIGREQLVAAGPESLSLRAVARELGVVSSAVYRYVRSRDELLTLLVVDAYTELGDSVDAAIADVDGARAQFFALGHTVRAWALREPSRYALLFGTPVPGYHAPGEQTTDPGTRVVVALLRVLERAHAAGALASGGDVDPALAEDLRAIADEFRVDLPESALARGALAWASLFGVVSFELFGQYGAGGFPHREALFDHHLAVLADTVGLAGVPV
ncbi:TetR/AcrR family transcriptional regulator [Rhodococcus sp. HNM0569]|uniref:TetR/AcrR family transcriptional regulator n=1 Tax=Rhodococcus sp. HNM0569 TaxID=2716340 RepID=UPI00146F556A|nr:TetR/AcrR family transcriptional regulator [Rhodococcus sp. HNM0569]NLU84508.1 TetR/AcrR family transcriptional regulator [Rhodococcus sp. HNM0569]